MKTVKVSELQIGDIVRLDSVAETGYGDATVYQIENGKVHVIRPFIQAADFLCTAGVLTYLGHEDFYMHISDDPITLLRRQNPEEYREKTRAIIRNIETYIKDGHTDQALYALRQL